MSTDDLRTPQDRRRNGPRGPVFVWANVVVLCWLAVAAGLLVAHSTLGISSWVALHALLLGAVTNAIVIWSEHFAEAFCRMPSPPSRRLAFGLTALNTLVVAVLVGVSTDTAVLVGVGGTGIAVIATVHAIHLRRATKATAPESFDYLPGFYCAASLTLALGAVVGALLALGSADWYARLWSAHVHLTLLGWVGLSVLGTMFTLWPVTLHARIRPDTAVAARRALPMVCAGLVVAVVGMLASSVWLAVAGLLGYAAGIGIAVIPLIRNAVQRRPEGPAAWMLGAAMAWLSVAVLTEAVRLAVRGSLDALPTIASDVLPVLTVGFTLQVLMGALTQLLPAILGRGPHQHRRMAETLCSGWQLRVLLLNVSVPLVAGPWPAPLPLVGWTLAAVSLVTFLIQALRIAIPVARHGSLEQGPRHIAGTTSGVVAGLAVVALAVAFAGTGQIGPPAVSTAEQVRTIDVTLADMRIQPDVLDVAPGTHVVLRVSNVDAMPHDLRVDSGARTPLLRQGQTALLDLGRVDAEMQGWCTVAGHRAAGMTMSIRTGAAAPTPHAMHMGDETPDPEPLDLSARPAPDWKPHEARLAPADGPLHRVELTVTEREVEVAPGRTEQRWTFGDSVPGPTLRGKVGDRFEVTLINDGTMGHSIDFHAGMLAPDEPMRTIAPGERLTYRFTATHAGAWLYHCATMPMSLHIANGMYGAVIIDPPDLTPADREYVLVSSQVYLGDPGSGYQTDRLRAGQPDGWAFNGMAAQYDHAPLQARVGERVRIWVVNAGPGDSTAFHVVGGQFDTTFAEGAWLLRPDPETRGASQVLNLAPAQGGFVELTFPEAGNYPFVDHDMRHGENGAHGVFAVTE